MSRWANGLYVLTNPEKYVGKNKPRYRSGWEHSFMRFCDNNTAVLQWASESISIPYKNPITGKNSMYVPDFFITYRTKGNVQRAEMIEIKPKNQSVIESKMKSRDRAVVAINYAKWAAAQAWCKRAGIHFRVITEDDLFTNGKR